MGGFIYVLAILLANREGSRDVGRALSRRGQVEALRIIPGLIRRSLQG